MHARDPVGAGACLGLRDEIPDGLFADEAKRIDGAGADVAVGAGVEKGELAVAGEGVLHDGEHREVFGGGSPAGGVDVKSGLNGVGLKAHGGWHGGHELVEGALGGGGEFAVAESAGLGHEEGLEFGVVEAGDFGAPASLQLPAAGCAAMGDEGNARCT